MPHKRSETESIISLIEEKLSEHFSKMATVEGLNEIKDLILSQNERIEQLEGHVSILQNTVKILKREQESSEQYSRRLCLRFDGIPPEKDENADDSLEKVKTVFNDIGVVIPDSVLDRAHRVGRPYINKDNEKVHPMIVRFTTWRHRTLVYNARKKSNIRIYLDLTKQRHDLLKTT